jgi:hypothetical protein
LRKSINSGGNGILIYPKSLHDLKCNFNYLWFKEISITHDCLTKNKMILQDLEEDPCPKILPTTFLLEKQMSCVIFNADL